MSRMGAEAYRAKVSRAQAKERETSTPAGRYLLRNAVGKVARGLEAWLKLAAKRPGPQHSAYDHVKAIGTDVGALIACKGILDGISRTRGLTAIAVSIGRKVEDELLFRQLSKKAPSLFKKGLKKTTRSGYDHRRRTLKQMADGADELTVVPWEKRVATRVGHVLMEVFIAESGLVEEGETRRGRKTVKHLQATEGTLEWLAQAHDDHEFLYPFWMPTLDPPLSWEGLHGGGYHTDFLVRRPLVRFQRRVHLKGLDPTAFERHSRGVNLIQMTPWAVNENVLEVMRAFWEAGTAIADLPSQEDSPTPTKPADIATNEAALKDWKRETALTYQGNIAVRSNRLNISRTLMLAERYRDKPAFYYPHHCDWRGRVYPIPSFLHPQGTDSSRGLLQFAHGKPLDQAGARWLAIHGANCWGEDKVTFAARIQWVEDNRQMILSVADEAMDDTSWTRASKPWQFLAFCFEWADFLRTGYGYKSSIPVQMDGSNNGLQIFSLLMRDEAGARATNVSPTEVPEDIYADVAAIATKHLEWDVEHGGVMMAGSTEHNKSGIAHTILEACGGKLPRECTKRPVMTLPYGARLFSCRQYVREWFDGLATVNLKSTFPHATYLAPVVWDAIERTVGGASACMAWLQECARICTEHNVPLKWTTPNGFPVTQEYTKYSTTEIRTSIGDRVRWSNLREDTDTIRLKDQVNGVSPNFIHSLDAACLSEIVQRAARMGATHFSMIHDSYGTHAADAGILAHAIRGTYADIFEEDLLLKWWAEIQSTLPENVALPDPPERGSLDPQVITKSKYAFA